MWGWSSEGSRLPGTRWAPKKGGRCVGEKGGLKFTFFFKYLK